MIWGPLTMPDGSSAFPVYHTLGVQVLQLQLSWAETAPTRPAEPSNPADPAYQWPASLQEAIGQAAKYGIQIALMVKQTPPWANGGREPSWVPTDPADYAAFLQAASRRYPQIHQWMIWGEVTRPGVFDPMPPHSPVGPRVYAVLLESAYTALKAVSPHNAVIGGMTYTVGLDNPYEFLRDLRLPDGRPPRLDYYGHNPYSVRFPNLEEGPYAAGVSDINDIDTLHGQLERHLPRPAGRDSEAVALGVLRLLQPPQPRLRLRRQPPRTGALGDRRLQARRLRPLRRRPRLVPAARRTLHRAGEPHQRADDRRRPAQAGLPGLRTGTVTLCEPA